MGSAASTAKGTLRIRAQSYAHAAKRRAVNISTPESLKLAPVHTTSSETVNDMEAASDDVTSNHSADTMSAEPVPSIQSMTSVQSVQSTSADQPTAPMSTTEESEFKPAAIKKLLRNISNMSWLRGLNVTVYDLQRVMSERKNTEYIVRIEEHQKGVAEYHYSRNGSNPHALPFLTFTEARDFIASINHCTAIGSGTYNTVYAIGNDEKHVLRIVNEYTEAASVLEECERHMSICAAMPSGRVPRMTGLVAFAYYDSEDTYPGEEGAPLGESDKYVRVMIAQVIERIYIRKFPHVYAVLPTSIPPEVVQVADTWAIRFLNAAVDICDAQIYHGDINEGNLVMSTDGVKMFDFDYDSCVRNAADYTGCDDNETSFGVNSSSQVEAPESICSLASILHFSESRNRLDLWRARDVICAMGILASRYPPDANPFHAERGVIGNDVSELINLCITKPKEVYDLDKNTQTMLLSLMERLGLAYATSEDACDYFTMRRSGCFESAQIFTVAMNTLRHVYGGTMVVTAKLDASLRIFSPSVANILLRCLHPMPMRRIKPDELRKALGDFS